MGTGQRASVRDWVSGFREQRAESRERGVGDVKSSKPVYWLCVETFETDFTECNNSQLDICMNRIYSIHTLLKFPWRGEKCSPLQFIYQKRCYIK